MPPGVGTADGVMGAMPGGAGMMPPGLAMTSAPKGKRTKHKKGGRKHAPRRTKRAKY